MQIKNIPKNIPRYLRKASNWRQNSYPRISGDLFSDESDISFYNPRFRGSQPSLREASKASVIFCPSHNLEQLLDEYRSSLNAKVLILGNSDRDFDSFEFQLPPSVKTVFLQNSSMTNSRFISIPIGIENLRLGTNGVPSLFTEDMISRDKKEKVLVGPLGLTHPERSELFSHLIEPLDSIEINKDRLTPWEYADFSSSYRFVACPRGNGLDTHRFWETLYRGSLPIVLDGNWTRAMERHGLPLIKILRWGKIEIENAIGGSNTRLSDPKLIEALWWPYWKNLIEKAT